MYFKFLLPFVLILATSLVKQLTAQAQPPICPTDEVVEMSPFCEEACIICDIDGFSGRNGRDNNFFLPDDFCTQVQHNGKWIGFIAGSENLRVQLSVSNCEFNIGLEIGIYEAIDCSNPVRVGSCFGGFFSIPPGTSQVFENTQPLVIGQYYYMVMDGGLDDVCDWEFTVLEGSTAVQPLSGSGPIIGPNIVCPNVTIPYETVIETGATLFNWTVDGNLVAEGPNPELIWNQEGTFELCVTAANACDEAEPFCTSVLVRTIPTRTIDTTFCTNEAFVFGDSMLTQSGQYNFNFTTQLGCDSNFVINLTEVQASEETITLNVCNDDVLELNGQTFDESGTYQQMLTNQFGCDSTLNINLTFIECTIIAEARVTDIDCPDDTDAEVRFTITNGVPVFFYEFFDLAGNVIDDGVIGFLNSERSFSNVSPGQYQISILDQFGNSARILNIIVAAPAPLEATAELSDFNGSPLSCFGANDGTIRLDLNGGTAPYDVTWDDNSSGLLRENLSAGTYAFTFTDANACSENGTITLEQPSEIQAQLAGVNAGCDGANTATIQVVNPSGGAGDYRYQIQGETPTQDPLFSNLTEGIYQVNVIDANGCSSTFSDTLEAAIIPQFEISQDVVIVPLGDRGRIGFNSINADRIVWTNEVAMSIIDSSSNFISIQPSQSGILIANALSVDGCAATDSIRIIVENQKKVFAPNAFSPNGDGVNDVFKLFPGQSVAAIEGFQVFDRWGALVFEQFNSTPEWDGQNYPTGTYVWRSMIVYLNGERELLTGDVVLLR